MSDEYADYRCSACKKAIKNQVVACKTCVKFYHPGCGNKHKVYDRNREFVSCPGPYEKIIIESESDMKAGTSRERLGSMGSTGSDGTTGPSTTPMSGNKGTSTPPSIDVKIDWLVRTVREIKDEATCKKEIRKIIKEVVQEELGDIKQQLEDLRRSVQGAVDGAAGVIKGSYSEAVKGKKKENVIIIKPKIQQESEATKKLIKEKVDIKSMDMGITKLKKGSKGTVILGCETGEEMEKLKITMQNKLGESFKVVESPQTKPKVKIINIDEEDMKLKDEELIGTIRRQNKINSSNEDMRIVKRIIKNNNKSQRGKEEGSVIIEVDEEMHELLLKKEKLNVGWKRCPVFNHIGVKRCFKCWGYYHIAKNCTRNETCHKCAGNHKADVCMATKNRCVNCMFKIRTYNLKISDEHDALSPECPTYKRSIQEERRRAGWDEVK